MSASTGMPVRTGNAVGANGVSYKDPYDAGRRNNQGILMTDLILVF